MRAIICLAVGLSLSVNAWPVAAQPLPEPSRPLHAPVDRPLPGEQLVHVDSARGDDAGDGSLAKPFKTLAGAARDLKPGQTVVLRGGVYYGHTTVTARGTANRPITLRSAPGEVAILDGGIADFATDPASAWEPDPDGVAGEYRSTRTYADLNAGRGGEGDGDGDCNVFGNFADTMVPLHAYRFHGDLQADNPFWNVTNKVGGESFVYCGPGIWYNAETDRIHCRLAHGKLPALGDDNYRGPTDPRQVKLVVAGRRDRSPLTLDGAQHVRLQDLVIRGAAGPTLLLEHCRHVELDHVTLYGGASCMTTRFTRGLRIGHSAFRGLAAPWTFRGSLKYRSVESRLFSGASWDPSGQDGTDYEFAWCEFTDSVDGVFFGNIKRVRIHHSLLDNVSDDGFFCTANTGYDGETPGGDVRVYQNRLARTLTTFAFGVGHGRQRTTVDPQGAIGLARQTGAGLHIYRNVFDFRRPVMYYWPKSADDPLGIHSLGRFAGDHGGPLWEPMAIYNNTILAGDTPRYDYFTDGLGKAVFPGTVRRVANNVILQKVGLPGGTMPKPEANFIGDGNLYWTVDEAARGKGDPLAKFRKSPEAEQSKEKYRAGWAANDLWADPQLTQYSTDWQKPVDVRLKTTSQAIDTGVKLPDDFPDPLRSEDVGNPDRGALPAGVLPWRVGVQGRLLVDGRPAPADAEPLPPIEWTLSADEVPDLPTPPDGVKTAAVYTGYPAFDEPIITYLLRKQGTAVDLFERTFPDADALKKYDLVVVDGSMLRAKLDKSAFADDELPKVRAFLENGGTLLLMRERTDLFKTDAGRAFLTEIGMDKSKLPASPKKTDPRPAPVRVKVGRGQVIYMASSPAADLPNGREKSTVAMEEKFLEQVRVLQETLR